MLVRPDETIQRRVQRLDELSLRLDQAVDRHLAYHQHRLATQAATLEALSPVRTLGRGYSIARHASTGRIIRQPTDIAVGDTMMTQLSQSTIESVVTKTS